MPDKTSTRPSTLPQSDKHRVDVDIDQLVMDAAKTRLALVQRAEIAKTGVASTHLADVGRAILVAWEPGQDNGNVGGPVDARGYRRRDDLAPLTPLRFTISRELFRERSRRMRSRQTTVTRVLEVGLERFARTGWPDWSSDS